MSVLALSRSVPVGTGRRHYTLVRPDGAPSALPLILAFHGSAQSGQKFRTMLRGSLDRLAAAGEAVVAYPDGVDGHWNDARRGSDFKARQENVDDLAFAQAIVDQLGAERKADPRRVYALGFSQGGQMVLRLLHERPHLLSGAALVGATMPAGDNWIGSGEPSPQVPIMIIAGTADPCSPYDGGDATLFGFRTRGPQLSAQATAEQLARARGIDGPPRAWQPSHRSESGAQSVLVRQWGDGKAAVRLYTVAGGGHRVPVAGAPARQPLLGRTTADIDTGTELAAFLMGA